MSRVFFISDLHFGHNNLVKKLRNMSTYESDRLIIDNWNKTVHKRDTVYVLGDITMENPSIIEYYLSQLHGTIRIIGGNHDTKTCCKKIMDLGITIMGCMEYKGFICTHIPIHPRELQFYRGNIHGHVHKNGRHEDEEAYNIKNGYFNVCCEFINYTPILFDDIVKQFQNIKQKV